MNVCVIGGGAAGCMTAIMLARQGISVTLVEKNEKIGKKLYLTGKGRCNLTNDCDFDVLFEHIVHGEKYLRSALYSFSPRDTMSFFESAGLSLSVERGNRVFPESQKSSDVIKTLVNELKKAGVNLKLNCAALNIEATDDGFKVSTDLRSLDAVVFDKVVVATGGVSYPSTGSTGDGYGFAKAFGHTIVEPKQALAPILVAENVSSLQGISLKNVRLDAIDCNGKVVAGKFGELMFTGRGLSGPVALTLSSYVNRMSGVTLSLDLKPSLDDRQLEARILRDFDERKNQDIKNVTRALLPERLNTYVLKRADIAENKKVNAITKDERSRLAHTVKNLTFKMTGLAPFGEAVVTSGGVALKSLYPSGESRLRSGLYFVGETVDVDALTGGFNLQIAFATAVACARDIIKKCGL
ncbi:MAG: NAD(P)/FAD-dependent oxidoreductase [Bacteroides sp.]|nr:NAD(P)/FAD-dependent oxidoreductase [Bacillota bacterium]MCM1393920.1 NAD(P)/FAD-dependent oxidoreductase [[Eubacterium] siraeum]MCM1456140.1 NAD(P)/FAD-dependent oxidoreductase [Bacteroides sp.]